MERASLLWVVYFIFQSTNSTFSLMEERKRKYGNSLKSSRNSRIFVWSFNLTISLLNKHKRFLPWSTLPSSGKPDQRKILQKRIINRSTFLILVYDILDQTAKRYERDWETLRGIQLTLCCRILSIHIERRMKGKYAYHLILKSIQIYVVT